MSATPTTADAERIAYIERYREEPIMRRQKKQRKPRQHGSILKIDDLHTHNATEEQQNAVIKYLKDAYRIKGVYVCVRSGSDKVLLFNPIKSLDDFRMITSYLDGIFDVRRVGVVPPSYWCVTKEGNIPYVQR